MSFADSQAKYQFTYDERKEILDCVKEYFQLSKEERRGRRYQNLSNDHKKFFEKWTSNKSFDCTIAVQSWPDELGDIDMTEMEDVYLDKDYYRLLPFTMTLDYTKKVMDEFLGKGERMSNDEYFNDEIFNCEIENEKIEHEENRTEKMQTEKIRTQKIRTNKVREDEIQNEISGDETASTETISDENCLNEFTMILRSQDSKATNPINSDHNERNEYDELSRSKKSNQRSSLNLDTENRLNQIEKSTKSLIKQRLVNKKVWLNEQVQLSVSNEDANFSDFSDDTDDHMRARRLINKKRTKKSTGRSPVKSRKTKDAHKTKVTLKTNRQVRKNLADLHSDTDEDLMGQYDLIEFEENNLKTFNNPKMYLITFILSFLTLKLFSNSFN